MTESQFFEKKYAESLINKKASNSEIMNDSKFFEENYAESLLKKALNNESAGFKEGQWEAIDALVNKLKRVLVVQKTGWGKSIVYFIAARLLKKKNKGLTLVISPLLALMRNQVDSATKLGLSAFTINSTNSSNKEDRDEITKKIEDGEIDLLLVSPERLSNQDFLNEVLEKYSNKINMLVVDEAHCISDWGHDFRPDYKRISSILRTMPSNVPILGTTATANNRVIDDIKKQFGNIEIQRGPLLRESISLHVRVEESRSKRLAWLASEIPNLPGSGIVYTSTTRDAELVNDWLQENKIESKAYHSFIESKDMKSVEYRPYLENLLFENKIKVLVATTALGMGYDKKDLGFVIHYQAPNSIISYYQQVGRAGRQIDESYGILFFSSEDQRIQEHFRRQSLPEPENIRQVLSLIESSDGLKTGEILRQMNLRTKKIEHILKFLAVENNPPIVKDENNLWHRTPNQYFFDEEKAQAITLQRKSEWDEFVQYQKEQNCLMQYLGKKLDDPQNTACGKCSVCIGRDVWNMDIVQESIDVADIFLRKRKFIFSCKKLIPWEDPFTTYEIRRGFLSKDLRSEDGRFLSLWDDGLWGTIVKDDKQVNGVFRDEILKVFLEMIEDWKIAKSLNWITCIPSNNSDIVSVFSRKVAEKLNLPFIAVIKKARQNDPQKLQENPFHQCVNLDGAFKIEGPVRNEPVLLIDDVIDSGWTLTVASILLRQSGVELVYPTALTSSKSSGN